jgi:hypothetical protein
MASLRYGCETIGRLQMLQLDMPRDKSELEKQNVPAWRTKLLHR